MREFFVVFGSIFFCFVAGNTHLRRLPRIGLFGGGMQFASLIRASSRRLAAIVENFARLSGVILFIVENARAACSSPFFRSFCVVVNWALDNDGFEVGVVDGGGGGFTLAVRQCLSYRIENKTIKYSISAKNTNSVHDMSQTCKNANIELTLFNMLLASNTKFITSRHFNSSASGELLRTVSNIVTNDKSVVTRSTCRNKIKMFDNAIFLFLHNSHSMHTFQFQNAHHSAGHNFGNDDKTSP